MTIDVKESHFSVWKLFISVLIVVILALTAGFTVVIKDSGGVDIKESITIDIPEGAGSSVAADLLYESNAIKYPSVFKLYSRLGGFDGEYKPGILTIHNNMSYKDILSALVLSERNSTKIVVPEGYTVNQIASVLADAGLCTAEEFTAALHPTLYDYGFLQNLPERNIKLEGYLFPATYEIMPGSSAQDIVKLMLDRFNDVFTAKYREKAAEMDMSIDEVITMASIIERETNADTERAKVAGIFYNRINSGMKLESCATVQYILGENKPVLSISDTQIDSPYNTYQNTGLPVGPICSPGEECIKAALYPEDTDAFYFLLGKNGEHIFSVTYEEHQKAMEENGL